LPDKIAIGNTHQSVAPTGPSQQNSHKWCMFVRPCDPTLDLSKLIDKVVFELHPSFFPPVCTVYAPGPFEISRLGWGYFDITVNVHWKNGKKSVYVHQLDFTKDLTTTDYQVDTWSS